MTQIFVEEDASSDKAFIVWSPAHEVGVETEPETALVAEIDDCEYGYLMEHLNAVVYPTTGYWKVSEWANKDIGLICGGREPTVELAIIRAERELEHLWKNLGDNSLSQGA